MLVVLALFGWAPRASAQTRAADAGWDRFAGVWLATPGSARIIDISVREATEPMAYFIRGIAREILFKRFAPPAWIRMERRNENFLIEFAGSRPQVLPLNGTEVREGNARLRAWIENGVLLHTGGTNEGTRDNVFRLNPADGSLTMETTVISPKLPRPVHFTLCFTRQRPAR